MPEALDQGHRDDRGYRQPILASLAEFSKAHVRRLAKAREVRVVRLRPSLRAARHVVIAVVHNEAPRMAAFLAHHRKLGFDHFIIVDNRSEDGLLAQLAAETDVSVFSAGGAFRRARYGNDWVNGILSRFCSGKWILYVDADEHFVFPHADQEPVAALTRFLEANGRASLPCIMVDMYSDRPLRQNVCEVGQDPIEVCDRYDGSGYVELIDPHTGIRWIKGGVRGRLFFPTDLWQGPALNKTPLVHWRRPYAFLKSSHELYPPRANQRTDGSKALRGALLHFKFLSTLPALLLREQARRQHTDEYRAYAGLQAESHTTTTDFVGPATVRYQGWRSLARDGLILGTGWPERSTEAHPGARPLAETADLRGRPAQHRA